MRVSFKPLDSSNLAPTLVFLTLCLASASGQTVRPSIVILDPAPSNGAIFTGDPTISLKGTATGVDGIATVTWEPIGRFGDTAAIQKDQIVSAAVNWSTGTIGLRPGPNRFRISALDQSNQSATTLLTVFYQPANPTPPEPIDIRTSFYHGRAVTYHVVNGLAMYEGDIVLGTADQLEGMRIGEPGRNVPGRYAQDSIRPQGITIAYSSELWPTPGNVGRVPYDFSGTTSAAAQTAINNAITQFNAQLSGVIQYVTKTGSDTNFVHFDIDPNDHSFVCFSFVGMSGGSQQIGGSNDCTPSEYLHEMGHAIGAWHEQQRMDRNTFVQVLPNNIDKPQLDNFNQLLSDEVDIGLYDYGSIMHYFAEAFSKHGVSTTIESIPAGIPLSQSTGYTAGNIDTFKRLYRHAPTSVTIDSNPSGAQVIIDGQTLTAPQVFNNWTIGSQHTLNLPADPQTIGGAKYMFGRWNFAGGTTASQTVTINAGDGSLFSPSSSPAVTVYTANFSRLHPFGLGTTGSGSGTAVVNPLPSITFSSVNYFVDRQLVTMTATPNGGSSFYEWFGFNGFNFFANPMTFYVRSDEANVQAGFTTNPVTIIAATAPGFPASGLSPSLSVKVDNAPTSTPTNFFDWTAGSPHTIDAHPTTQSPVTTNISYAWSSWSDGLGQSHSINQVGNGAHQTITANFSGTFRVIVDPMPFCGGTISPSQDAPVADGTVQNFQANPNPGFAFVGWSGDLTGTANPNSTVIHDELLAAANFNVIGSNTPIAISSFSPSTVAPSPNAFNLTVNGAGFANTSGNNQFLAFWNNQFRTATFNSSTSATVHLNAGDIQNVGYNRLNITNRYTNPNTQQICDAIVEGTVNVKTNGPSLSVAKIHTGNFTQGQQNAHYTVTVSNAVAAGPTDGSTVTVTESVPSGLTLVSMAGTNWTCPANGNTCTRNGILQPNTSYEAITITVNVAGNATSPQLNQVSVSGGGSATATTSDSTVITGPTLITHTWVASTGSDGNTCSRSSPCRTFQGAHDKTTPGGSIKVVDPADYLPVTINKAITIDGGGVAVIGAPSGIGITVSAGSSDQVILRNLSINGLGGAGTGLHFNSGQGLRVENVSISDFTGGGGKGISVSTGAFAVLTVENTTITDCNTAGISISSSVIVAAELDHVRIWSSGTGLAASNGARVTLRNSELSLNSASGVALSQSGQGSEVDLISTTLNYNNKGVQATGANTVARITHNMIMNNGTGLSPESGGQIVSAGDNTLVGNFTNGAPTSSLTKR